MKHRLRHPIRAIREPFGTAGLIIACVALVAALGGTALAAKGALTGKQKKEVEKIAKKYAGKPGAPGAAGAAGPAGPAGPAGTNGKAGAPGTNGTNGKEGSPWTAGGTLPKGSTEAGMATATNVGVNGAEHGQGNGAISFGIPLASLPTAHYVNPSGEEETSPGVFGTPVNCHGSFEHPSAPEGSLCIYGKQEISGLVAFAEVTDLSSVGAVVHTNEGVAGLTFIASWAVTGD